MSSRRRNLEATIDSWYEWKESMKKHFIPQYSMGHGAKASSIETRTQTCGGLLQGDGYTDGST